MKVAEVFRFELEYRIRQPSTWVYALVLFGLPFLLLHAIDGSSQFLNAPIAVMEMASLLGGISMLITAGIFGDAAARDVQTRMHALFYTSPVQERHYLTGRFLGALVINAVLVMGVPLGLLLASVMPYMSEGKFGPVHIAAYVQPYLMMLLPNVIIIGSFMFAAAALTRQALATYVGGIVLFVLGAISGEIAQATGSNKLETLLDPFGGQAITATTALWTPAEQGSRLIGWPTAMLTNRALWIVIAVAVFALMVSRFRFAHPGRVRRLRAWWRRAVVDTAPDRIAPIPVRHAPAASRSFELRGRVAQTLAVATHAWREIAATKSFLLVLVGAMLFMFAVGWNVGSSNFGTSSWPVTHLIAGTVLSSYLPPVIALLIAIFAGELVWREREVGMGDIAAVAPVSNGVALLGQFVALVGMLVLLQATFMAAGMVLQSLQGYTRFEIGVYLKLLFGLKLFDYVLLAALAMAVHVVVNNKYLGHLIVVVYFVSTLVSDLLGITQAMLVYGSDPGWIWSDMNGLAPFVKGIFWFKLYWAAWALLFALLTSLFWVRGRELGVQRRLALARQRLQGSTLRAFAVAVALIITLSGFVFYNTNIVNDVRGDDEILAEKADYERKYKRFADAPKPSLFAARMHVELYPSRQAADIKGTVRLINRTNQPIDSLHVLPSLTMDVKTGEITFDRAARLVTNDSVLLYRIYALERTLAPGDSIAMTFALSHRPRGFRNAGAPTDVVSNGTYIESNWLPLLGYQQGREVFDEKKRRELGLPRRQLPPTAGDVEARPGTGAVQLADVETIIGTEPSQTAITLGSLVREWTENGRRYFHYRTDQPIRYGFPVLSAEYALRTDTVDSIALSVYYHPAHDVNVDRMIGAMRASLAYYGEHFGPYQYKELRIVEFPRYMGFARGHPHTVTFSEGSAFLTRVDSGDVDRTSFVVAHETAHQWWGGQVIPAQVAGAAMVSESLAMYSSMMVLEEMYGTKMTREFYEYNMKQYFTGRTVYTNREVPLLDVVSNPSVHYFKGAVAMYTLRDRLGADAVNTALRRFRDMYAGPAAPPPTSYAVYEELKAVTPDSLKTFLSDLFEHITIWDLHADSAKSEQMGGGQFRVTLFVDASKARSDSIGNLTRMEMDDLVEIGVFGGNANDQSPGDSLYVEQHRIRGGKQTISVTVPRLPMRAGIDPYRKFIERDREDNISAIAIDTTP